MRYLTPAEAAKQLNIDPTRVRRLCQQRRIRTVRIGRGYGISERELARFAAIPRPTGRPATANRH